MQRIWQPEQSFILAGFILSVPRPAVGHQHFLHNCVDHLAARSQVYSTLRSAPCWWQRLSTVKRQRLDKLPFFFGVLAFLQILLFWVENSQLSPNKLKSAPCWRQQLECELNAKPHNCDANAEEYWGSLLLTMFFNSPV